MAQYCKQCDASTMQPCGFKDDLCDTCWELRANLTTEQYASYRDKLPTRNLAPECICDGCE